MLMNDTVRSEWALRLLSIVRIFVALLYLQHGLSKYLGFPAPPPANFQVLSLYGLAGAIEIIGSLLLLLGLFTRPAAFIMSGEMAAAYFIFINRPARNFFPLLNGGELEALFCLFFFTFFLFGGGSWSVDAVLSRTRSARRV
jgi:putative oxidoreductase